MIYFLSLQRILVMTFIKNNLSTVQRQINDALDKFARSKDSVKLLAVSKTKPITAIEKAYEAGQRDFGENYLQESVDKITQLAHLPDAVWHFIGPIQSNKTTAIANNFSWVHSVDRAKIARRLNEQRSSQDTPLNVCLQVNISGESTKSGMLVEELDELAQIVDSSPNLVLRGIMAIPKKDAPKSSYVAMNELYISLKSQFSTVDTFSMGMSADLEIAIEHGSTMVRIGTAIFGART